MSGLTARPRSSYLGNQRFLATKRTSRADAQISISSIVRGQSGGMHGFINPGFQAA